MSKGSRFGKFTRLNLEALEVERRLVGLMFVFGRAQQATFENFYIEQDWEVLNDLAAYGRGMAAEAQEGAIYRKQIGLWLSNLHAARVALIAAYRDYLRQVDCTDHLFFDERSHAQPGHLNSARRLLASGKLSCAVAAIASDFPEPQGPAANHNLLFSAPALTYSNVQNAYLFALEQAEVYHAEGFREDHEGKAITECLKRRRRRKNIIAATKLLTPEDNGPTWLL